MKAPTPATATTMTKPSVSRTDAFISLPQLSVADIRSDLVMKLRGNNDAGNQVEASPLGSPHRCGCPGRRGSVGGRSVAHRSERCARQGPCGRHADAGAPD